MMAVSTRGSSRTASVGAATIASLSGTVLAADNALGFVGAHLLGTGVAPLVVVSAVLAAAASVAFSVRTRDLARGLGAAAVLGFVLALSPAVGTALWLPLSIALQALVPLSFVVSALITRRTSVSRPVRTWAAVLAVLAVVWGVGAFVPMRLEVFLALQMATLLTATIIAGSPLLRQVAVSLRRLWDSAGVR